MDIQITEYYWALLIATQRAINTINTAHLKRPLNYIYSSIQSIQTFMNAFALSSSQTVIGANYGCNWHLLSVTVRYYWSLWVQPIVGRRRPDLRVDRANNHKSRRAHVVPSMATILHFRSNKIRVLLMKDRALRSFPFQCTSWRFCVWLSFGLLSVRSCLRVSNSNKIIGISSSKKILYFLFHSLLLMC